jgi:hypothetical protein
MYGGDYWVPAFAGMTTTNGAASCALLVANKWECAAVNYEFYSPVNPALTGSVLPSSSRK